VTACPLPAALVCPGIGHHDQTHQSKIEAIKPDQQDFDAVEKEYGPLPPNANQAALVAMSPSGQGAAYPIVETVQVDGICREVIAPAPELGRLSSNPPGKHAGNLDNKELVVGSVLFIPVFVRGALFEVGDGHAAQGDGEVDQTAIETSLRGRLQLTVRKDMKLAWPRAETPTDYISMATDPDLFLATRSAIQEMVDFLMAEKHLTRHEAYQLVSIAGNVAITQLVDKPNVGVHVRLPKSIFVSG